MKQVSNRGYLLVGDFPEGSKDFGICMIKNGRTILSWHESVNEIGRGMDFSYEVKSFNGLWEIIGKGNEITETQCEKIVEYSYGGYHDYDVPYKTEKIVARLPTANEAVYSLIKSHGMKPSETLILKLKTDAK